MIGEAPSLTGRRFPGDLRSSCRRAVMARVAYQDKRIMAMTLAMRDSEQKFSGAEDQLIREVAALRRLANLSAQAAEALSTLSLEAFALARAGEKRADGPGNDFLQRAESYFRQAQIYHSEAEALWRHLGS